MSEVIGEVMLLEDGTIVVKLDRDHEFLADEVITRPGRLSCFDGYDNAVEFVRG